MPWPTTIIFIIFITRAHRNIDLQNGQSHLPHLPDNIRGTRFLSVAMGGDDGMQPGVTPCWQRVSA
jgi:hypothetical protein